MFEHEAGALTEAAALKLVILLHKFLHHQVRDTQGLTDSRRQAYAEPRGSGRNSASSPKIKSGGSSGYWALKMISPRYQVSYPQTVCSIQSHFPITDHARYERREHWRNSVQGHFWRHFNLPCKSPLELKSDR